MNKFIFLNDEEIKEFLTYIENTTESVAKKSNSELIKKVHEKVVSVRNSQECEVEFMTYQERLREEREDGIEQKQREIVEEMLKENFSLDVIVRITKLSEEKIKEMQQNLH